MLVAGLACVVKFAAPPACVHEEACLSAHLSHGRGSAGEFLPDAEAAFVMGAATEVATLLINGRLPDRWSS